MVNVVTLHRIVDTKIEMFSDITRDLMAGIVESVESVGCEATTLGESFDHSIIAKAPLVISLTFDDGWDSHYQYVFPLLVRLGMKATFFITVNWVGKKNYLNWGQIREMSVAGMEIGSHTMNHPMVTDLKKEEIIEEVGTSKSILEDKLGREIKGFSFPGGFYNREAIKIVRDSGYSLICTSRPGINRGRPGLIRRNSINSLTDLRDLTKIIMPGRLDLLGKEMLHITKGAMIGVLGERNYVLLRNKLFR